MSSPINNSNDPTMKRGWPIYFIVLIFSVAILEILFRIVVFPQWRSVSLARFEEHPIYGTFQKPNLSVRRFNPPNYDVINTTNSWGFRDRENGFEDDLAGIWMAGASNSYGGFMEDDEIMSAQLQAIGFKNANLSSEGHKLRHQMRVVRHLTDQGYRPRAVIFELTLNNILSDYTSAIKELSLPLVVNRKKNTPDFSAIQVLVHNLGKLANVANVSLFDIKARLINNSAIYTWAKVGVNSVPFLRQATLRWGLRADVALVNSIPVSVYRDEPGNPADVIFDLTADYIAVIRGWIADNLNVPFAVILVPGGHQLNRDWFERYMSHLGLNAEEYYPSRPYVKLLSALRNRGIAVLDTALSLESAGQFLNFHDDGHTNAVGHAIIARQLAAWLPNILGRKQDQ